jgi:hypothetical protein
MEQKRSLFGPLLLIAAGVVWLLVKAGTIPSANLWALTHIWPYLLIAAGLGIMLRSYWKYTSIVLDVLIIFAPLAIFLRSGGVFESVMISMFNTSEPFLDPRARLQQGDVVTGVVGGSCWGGLPALVLIKQGARDPSAGMKTISCQG